MLLELANIFHFLPSYVFLVLQFLSCFQKDWSVNRWGVCPSHSNRWRHCAGDCRCISKNHFDHKKKTFKKISLKKWRHIYRFARHFRRAFQKDISEGHLRGGFCQVLPKVEGLRGSEKKGEEGWREGKWGWGAIHQRTCLPPMTWLLRPRASIAMVIWSCDAEMRPTQQ